LRVSADNNRGKTNQSQGPKKPKHYFHESLLPNIPAGSYVDRLARGLVRLNVA
jgi:hypothetical protein